MAELDRLFRRVLELKASDLHLTSTMKPMVRLHGDILHLEEEETVDPSRIMKLLEEITPKRNLEEFREISDTDFAYELPGVGRFRANIFADRYGPGAVFRLIPSQIITAEQLGVPKEVLNLCMLPKGLIIVTGPTGSGKSTTLSGMIDYINGTRSDHIITIEDPIEFVHPTKKCLINQREVHVHTKSFKTALRAALREDPDIILVGEMRDLETIEIAIEMAETGHLVFGTLHTSTAATTVERVIQQFPGEKQNQIRMMLSTSLKCVVAQTLLKKADGDGRVAAMEVLIANGAVANLIREGKTHQIASSMQVGAKEGMVLLNDALIKLVMRGTVTAEEAYAKAVDKQDLTLKYQSYGIRYMGR